MTAIDHIILAWPKNLNDQTEVKPAGKNRSWIQLARTGTFTSTHYGKFAITKDDLATMLHNFTEITPKAPTELPIDYDHLSMNPKAPGDGVAAGWMKKLELRENGEELWAEVEWTSDGAERIAKQEYRFVSPSFVKDHVHKDGKKIGTTLLAAAITNHPFLDGMKALTLYSMSAMGDLALDEKSSAREVVLLSEVGQRVMIAPGHARTQDEVGGTFEITEVVGDGENAFVTVKDANGVPHKWFRATELLPASTTPANPIQKNLEPAPGTPTKAQIPGDTAKPATKEQEDTSMMNDSSARLLTLAQQYASAHSLSLSAAVIAVSSQHRELASTYLDESRTGAAPGPAAAPAPPIALTRDPDAGEQLLTLATELAKERRLDLRDAVKLASQQRPDLSAAWERG